MIYYGNGSLDAAYIQGDADYYTCRVKMAIASAATTNTLRIQYYLATKTKTAKVTKSEPNHPSEAVADSFYASARALLAR